MAFVWVDGLDEVADVAPCVLEGPLLGVSHPVLDLGEGLLDGIEVWRVWRQEPEPCPGGLDELADGDGFVAAEVVHDDDVARPERGDQQLLDIGAEAYAVDWALEDAGSDQAIAAQRTEEGQGAPVAVRGEAAQSPAPRTPAAQRRHVGLDPGLVDEHQPARIEARLPAFPALPPPGDGGMGLLKGEQRFF